MTTEYVLGGSTLLILVLIIFLAVASYVGFIVISKDSESRNKEFAVFLMNNANEIMNGAGARFDGYLYTGATQIKSYSMCISYLVMTSWRSTAYVPVDADNNYGVLTFLITLFGGWWGFPWGPIRTIETFVKNAGHKNVITVGQLIFSLYNQAN